jgi:isoquinoline 1-oxidoreductase beta subunit
VHVKPDACEVWTGTQILTRVQSEAAKAAGLPVEKVTVNNHLIGGGFGRRLEPDMVVAAVRVAKQVEGPVKVVWTREEDIRHDIFRPVYRDTISATLTDGKIVGWKNRVSGSAVIARWLPPAFQGGIDIDAVDSAVDMPYDIPNFHVEYVRAEPPAVPTGFWRGVGPNNNVFAIECFMDELARKAGKDPIDFRRGMLGKNPRLKAALDLVAEKSGWGQALPSRVGRGVSAQPSFGSFISTVVEAEVDEQGEVHLRRITSAVDTGIAVNPDTIVAQLQGGLIFGLTAALYGEITIDNGRVQQSNFNDYRMLRIDQVPKIDVHLIMSAESPGGIGETGVTAGPPALCNAIFAATGVVLRRLPIDRSLIAAGKKARTPPRVEFLSALSRSSWLRWRSASGLSAVQGRWRSRRVRWWRWPTIRPPIPRAFRRRLPRQARWSVARILRRRRTAWPATPSRAANHMQAASDSTCHSARSTRPTLRRTRRPASATTAIRIF